MNSVERVVPVHDSRPIPITADFADDADEYRIRASRDRGFRSVRKHVKLWPSASSLPPANAFPFVVNGNTEADCSPLSVGLPLVNGRWSINRNRIFPTGRGHQLPKIESGMSLRSKVLSRESWTLP